LVVVLSFICAAALIHKWLSLGSILIASEKRAIAKIVVAVLDGCFALRQQIIFFRASGGFVPQGRMSSVQISPAAIPLCMAKQRRRHQNFRLFQALASSGSITKPQKGGDDGEHRSTCSA